MQISPFHIQVLILIFHKKPRRNRIDNDTDPGNPGDSISFHRTGMKQLRYTLSYNDTDSDQQNDRIQ
jgi:hypothetical protein